MSKKRIAILGAGPSGLAQLRAFEAARLAGAKNLPEIVCYEKQNAIGGIDRFLVDGTCVGLQADSDGLTLYAPDGLAGLMDGVLRPNRRSPDPRLYAAKARNYQRRWPWLTVLDTVSEEPARPIFMHQIGF